MIILLGIFLPLTHSALTLTVLEQSLHTRHRPPPGLQHVEVPERVFAAKAALLAAPFASSLSWQATTSRPPTDALEALRLVHSTDHLSTVESMSIQGGGFDTDTYCAPGSWEAMLDGTLAWMAAVDQAAAGRGPAFALTRPAGHHATRNVAMGFGLVNFAAAAVAAYLKRSPASRVAVLDWDVHHGNGVSAWVAAEGRARYCSLHEMGGFPQTGQDESERGSLGNILNIPLPKGSGSAEYLEAVRRKALPFLLGDEQPDLLLICAGYDALEADPLATMALKPADYAECVRQICSEHGFPPERVALGLEGGYSLDEDIGMPAAVVATCSALLEQQGRGGGAR